MPETIADLTAERIRVILKHSKRGTSSSAGGVKAGRRITIANFETDTGLKVFPRGSGTGSQGV